MHGESIYTIARDYSISVTELLATNHHITKYSIIKVGQIITIPAVTINFGAIEVNGYAFPNISRKVLKKTLPSLTYLSIFSYEISTDGSLRIIPDEPLIQAAKAARVATFMVITNIKEDGNFNSDLAHTIFTNTEVQNNLISNITNTLKVKNYYGLHIDFEHIYNYDSENYNNFLRKVITMLKPLGYVISTTLTPKTSAYQSGFLHQGINYPAHGSLVDHVIIKTNEWGHTLSPPMAVAPLSEVRKVMNYAVSVMPRSKISMEIPNYGYNWTLPYKAGTAASDLSTSGAVDLARKVMGNIKYDQLAQGPVFRYYDKTGKRHEVRFEDARSILAKFQLAYEFGFGSLSYLSLEKYFPQNWLVLNSVYNVRKVI
jgi:spore germination protein